MRELAAHEVEDALRLLAAEGWTFERPELERLLRLGACLVLDEGGIGGLLTVTMYPGVAWIGNVVVASGLRGRGHGAALVEAAVREARRRGAGTVALYSVPKAVPLYARLGFVPHGRLAALHGPVPDVAAPAGVATMAREDLDEVAALDLSVTGLDRRALLAELHAAYPGHAHVARGRDGRVAAFAFGKPAWSGSEVGPAVAVDDEAASRVLDAAFAALGQGPVDLALPLEAETTLAHLARRGLARTFEPTFMTHGPPPRTVPSRVAAVGGLEKG